MQRMRQREPERILGLIHHDAIFMRARLLPEDPRRRCAPVNDQRPQASDESPPNCPCLLFVHSIKLHCTLSNAAGSSAALTRGPPLSARNSFTPRELDSKS